MAKNKEITLSIEIDGEAHFEGDSLICSDRNGEPKEIAGGHTYLENIQEEVNDKILEILSENNLEIASKFYWEDAESLSFSIEFDIEEDDEDNILKKLEEDLEKIKFTTYAADRKLWIQGNTANC